MPSKVTSKEFIDARGRAVKAHRFDRADVMVGRTTVARTLWAADSIDGDKQDGEYTIYALVAGVWYEVTYYVSGLWECC